MIAVEEVPMDETWHYSIAQPDGAAGGAFRIVNLIEEPRPEKAPSGLAIPGRRISPPVIFEMIRQVRPDARSEIQLTNAIQLRCEEGRRVMGVKPSPEEKGCDIGNFPSYFETFAELALANPVYGEDFRRVVERLLAQTAAAVQ